MNIFLITNYLNDTCYEGDENYIGYASSYDDAFSYIQSNLCIMRRGINPDHAFWFSDDDQTYLIREIYKL